MVANFTAKLLQGEKKIKFIDHIMGMSNGVNIVVIRKVREEIAQNEDIKNG